MDPASLRFTKTHEWVHLDGETATVGISAFAVKELTDVVHLEFPTVGKKVAAGQPFGEIESVKSVNDLYSPVGGEVVAVNAQLEGDLGLLGQDPYGAAWIVKIKVSDKSALDKLMDYNTYEASCQSH